MSKKMRTGLKKSVSMIVAVTTIVWLSGLAILLAPAITIVADERPSVVVGGVTVYDGDLISSNATNPDGTPTYASLDIYIAKVVSATETYKRLVLNPQVFDSYGHLKWGDVSEVSQTVMDAFSTSCLTREDGDTKVYAMAPDDDTGTKSWVNLTETEFVGATTGTYSANTAGAIYTINSTDAGNYTATGDLTTVSAFETYLTAGTLPAVSGVTGDLTVALASGTPASASVPKNAANVHFTKVNFTAGTSGATITGLKVTRTGLGVDVNISSVKLFVDGVQRSTSQSLGSTHKATFTLTSNPIVISANTTQAVVLAADIKTTPGTYDMHVLGIADSSDITTTATVAGTFPINGNVMTLADVAIGAATIAAGSLNPGTTSGDIGVNPNKTSYRFSQIKITADATEAINVSQLTVIKNGTAATTDVKNIELYNDTTGASLGIVESLNAEGKAVFDGLNLQIAKGGKVELSIKADLTGGSGRTVGFDVHDGTASTILLSGATYGYGITPTVAAAFCDTGVTDYTCQRQTITQGYLTISKSASAPSTGKIAVGGSEIPLMAFDFVVGGEPINVSQTVVTYTTAASGSKEDYTNWTLYLSDGTVLAGPKNGSGTGVGQETLTFTDAYTLPVGTNVVYAKADASSSALATETIHVDMGTGAVTAKGANSGKTTYNTSSGLVVPPATGITGNTMTLQGPALAVITAASPIAGHFVVNAQDQELAYIDFDASASAEDVRVTNVIVEDQVAGGSVAYTGVNNLELWGDPDNTDSDNSVVRLATSNSTATNAQITTFTFTTPLRVKKGTSSRLTLKMDVVNLTASTSHQFNIGSDGNVTTDVVTATGWGTGETAAKTYSGTGQSHTIHASGSLKVTKAADMPSAVQLVSAVAGNEVMKYKFTSAYEEIEVTEFYLFAGDYGLGNGGTQNSTATTLGNIDKIYLYVDGSIVGNTSGYSLDADGRVTVTLASGEFIVPKDGNAYLTLKIDIPVVGQVTTNTGTGLQIGIDTITNGTYTAKSSLQEDSDWALTAADYDYYIVATGGSSGVTIDDDTINDQGSDNGNSSQVYGSNGFSVHKGILTVTLNSSSPSGTQTPGANKEVLRIDLTAAGDDVIMHTLELINGGTVSITGTGDLTVKSNDLSTTYATATGAQCNVYNGGGGLICLDPTITSSISIGAYGCTAGAQDGTKCTTEWTTADNLVISAGTTKTIRIFGDTTNAASTKTYQMSVSNDSSNNTTDNGAAYKDSSTTVVGTTATTFPVIKSLPLSGGSLTY